MNNQELFSKFTKISKTSNSLDLYCELKKMERQYKKSSFYKQTRLSIVNAYKIFTMDGLIKINNLLHNSLISALANNDLAELSMLLEDFLSMFDYNKLDGLFIYIKNKLENLNLDSNGAIEELKKELNSFKSSL